MGNGDFVYSYFQLIRPQYNRKGAETAPLRGT